MSQPAPSSPASPGSPRTWLWAIRIVTRLFVVIVTLGWFNGDTETYFNHGRRFLLGETPYLDYPVEYPPAATLLFAGLATVGNYARFRITFVLTCLLVDAAIYAALFRAKLSPAPTGGPPQSAGRHVPPLYYAAASALLFPVLLVRFDLFPSAAVVMALLLLTRAAADPGALSPRQAAAAGGWLGLAIALKLYPLLFLPLFLLEVRQRRLRVAHFLIMAAAAAGVVVLTFLPFLPAGRAVFSFLQYQGERGLQIESSYASVLLLLGTFLPIDVPHVFSHHAHDVGGRLAALLAPVAKLVHPTTVLLVTWITQQRRMPRAAAFATITTAALCSSAVFSPQFLLWLLPLAFLGWGSQNVHLLGWLWLGIAGLTTLVFPVLYDRLIAGQFAAILVLFVRNALLFGLLLVYLRRFQIRKSG